VAELRYDKRVTGAGSGLGQAYAKFLASRGARVVVNDVGLRKSSDASLHPAESTVADITAAGGEAIANTGDVGSPADVEALIQDALDHFGCIDIVINNAAIDGGITLDEVTLEDLQRYLYVHVQGSFLVTKAAWPHLRASSRGRVVLTGSSATLGLEKRLHYTAAKGGVFGLMRTFAAEGRPYEINVNALWPLASTPMAIDAFREEALPDEHQRALEGAADIGLVTPVVGWLVHEDCPTTGQILHVACGKVARVYLAQGPGIVDKNMTVESIRDQWSAILDETPYKVLSHALDSTGLGLLQLAWKPRAK
jgi:NAD(P)-dependent dehydrogenase (short-subunit alcohol dehydrogenase family)